MENRTKHILLIEDNPGDADLVRLRLVEGRSPVEVNCVGRLSEGLATLAEKIPSVILLDLNLPDCHGAETYRRVLEHAPGVPVVVLSGQDDEALAIKAVNQGVQDYLVKGDISANIWNGRYAMRWSGRRCCARWKSRASSRWNSRTSSCRTFPTSCARRLPASTNMSRFWPMGWRGR